MKNSMGDAIAYLHMKIITGDKEAFGSLGLMDVDELRKQLLAGAFNYEEALYAAEAGVELKLLDRYKVFTCPICKRDNFKPDSGDFNEVEWGCVKCDTKYSSPKLFTKYAVSQVHLPYEEAFDVGALGKIRKLLRLGSK